MASSTKKSVSEEIPDSPDSVNGNNHKDFLEIPVVY